MECGLRPELDAEICLTISDNFHCSCIKKDVSTLCSCWQPHHKHTRPSPDSCPKNRAPADFPCGGVATPARDRPWDLSQEGVCTGGERGEPLSFPSASTSRVPGAPGNVATTVQGAWPQGAVGEPLTPQGSSPTSKVLPKATRTLAELGVISQSAQQLSLFVGVKPSRTTPRPQNAKFPRNAGYCGNWGVTVSIPAASYKKTNLPTMAYEADRKIS